MMSVPDYDQFAEDHQSILIVVKPIGPQIDEKLFNLIYENLLDNLNEILIINNKIQNFKRKIYIRYKKSYTLDENEWGDFQFNRKLLGLITIAQLFNLNEYKSIIELHRTIHDTFNSNNQQQIFNSKCFIIENVNNESKEPDEKNESNDKNDKNNDDDDNTNFNLDNDGGQLSTTTSTTDYTCFNKRVNCSSSTSSSEASLSTTAKISKSNEDIIIEQQEETMNYSLPSIQLTNDVINRTRTHSRNKSLDTKIFEKIEKKSINENNPYESSSMNEFIKYETNECLIVDIISKKIKEFLINLFWLLETKRLDKTREKKDKIPLLMAPCEKKDSIGLDTDTKSFKRKCLGRMQKHLADLSLMTGLPHESYLNYLTAIELLKNSNDKLWLAAAIEGLCSSTLLLQYPKRWKQLNKLRKKFQYINNSYVEELLKRNDYDIIRYEYGKYFKMIAMNLSIDDQDNDDGDCNVNLSNNTKINKKNLLTIEQFYQKYKESASMYALYRGAAIIEFECSIKAAKVFALYRQYLKASDFIQNAVFITLNQQTIDEQIERLLRISQLYEMIGFYRKAAFFKRFAALKTVSSNITNQKNLQWEKCYYLLLPSLYDYGLSLNPNEYDDNNKNLQNKWSTIHIQLLQEIITTSLKMKNEILAIRHLCFLLQCFYQHLNNNQQNNQRKELLQKLSQLSQKYCEGSSISLKLTNGIIIPSVNFTKFPLLLSIKIEPLKLYLRLYKFNQNNLDESDDDCNNDKNYGPFIYTPLQLDDNLNKHQQQDKEVKKLPFYWSEGHLCTVTITLLNYLPIELLITSISLMTDGCVFDPMNNALADFKILSNQTMKNIQLSGVPRTSGQLFILGYRIHTLGIRSDCYLHKLPQTKRLKLPEKYLINVVQRLPLMCAECLSYDNDQVDQNQVDEKLLMEKFPQKFISTKFFCKLFEGQRKSLKIKLTNISKNNDELIDIINIKLIKSKSNNDLNKLITIKWNEKQLSSSLPIGINNFIEFDLDIQVNGDFVFINNDNDDDNGKKILNNDKMVNDKQQQQQQQTKKLQQLLGSKKLANFLQEFQQSRKNFNNNVIVDKTDGDINDNELINKINNATTTTTKKSKIVEFCLQFEYSGGPGLNSGFCRHVNIYFNIEIQSSILITHWDVIQAEQMDECYLVLDTLNVMKQEINLQYSKNKEMLIESNEKCRIPVPIKRCLFDIVYDDFDFSHNKDFLKNFFNNEKKLQKLLQKCRQNLLKQIDIKWLTANSNDNINSGIVNIESVPLSNELLKSLIIPPIQTEITINNIKFYNNHKNENDDDDDDINMNNLIQIKIGKQLSIRINIINITNININNINVNLLYYQDYHQNFNNNNNQYNDNINDKILINGSKLLFIDELKSNESFLHKCGLTFLYAGIYKLEIYCQPCYDNDDNEINVNNQITSSLFKCLHTFEINVDE